MHTDSEPIPIPGAAPPLSKPKKDLMSDACRSGDDIIAYSINTARMNILWNRFSLFQLQHYIFARQMYFLLVHLRQPTRCAEKALGYMKSSYVSLEQRLARQFPVKPSTSPAELDLYDNNNGSSGSEAKMLQLRRAQADVWALMASLKLIRECRALLQLLVGGDAKFNSIFGPNLSYSVNSASINSASLNSAGDSFSDNLAAISSASTHGGSVVYNSLAELSRSQHGISCHRKSPLDSSTHPATHSVHGAHSTHTTATLTSTHTTPAMALRDVLFAPELDITTELRESSRVLGDLIEFALKRLQALSSSTVKNAGKRALELALTTVPFDYEKLSSAGSGASSGGGVRRTVTKVGTGTSAIVGTGVSIDAGDGGNIAFSNPNNASTIATTSSTDYSAVSPRNADLVVTIEQELALLDESRQSQGVADVGDRMDQVRFM